MDIEPLEFVELNTDRLYFRNFQIDDTYVLHAMLSHDRVEPFITMFDEYPSFEDVLFYVASTVKNQSNELHDFHWIIELDGNVVGLIHLEQEKDNPYQYSIGYCVDPSYWNQGIATEALKTVTGFAFDLPHISSVEVTIFSENQASKKVAEKAGYTHTGVKRDSFYKHDRSHDVEIYSILRTEKG